MRPLHQAQASKLASLRSPTGEYGVGVVIKRVLTYARRIEREVVVTDDSTYDDELLVAEADTAAVHRPGVDVVVEGSVYTPTPRPFIDASVRLGAAFKRVRVHAERAIRATRGNLTFERIAHITQARLSYQNAYGGRIQLPRRRGFRRSEVGADAIRYPRNPVGRGLALEAAALDGTLAPSQEDPSDPITPERLVRRSESDWLDAPLPASVGPVSLAWLPRAEHVVPRSPESGPDPRALCAASPGLTTAAVADGEILSCSACDGAPAVCGCLSPPQRRALASASQAPLRARDAPRDRDDRRRRRGDHAPLPRLPADRDALRGPALDEVTLAVA